MSPLPEGVRVHIAGDIPWMHGHDATVLWRETQHGVPGYQVQLPGDPGSVWVAADHLEPCDGIGGTT